METCSKNDCSKPRRVRGFCASHYQAAFRSGAIPRLRIKARRGEPQKFICAALASDTTECIPWPYAKAKGYGYILADGTMKLVSRIVCKAAHGPAFGRLALHECDNPPCINPKHLFWGNQTQNIQQCLRNGRHRWQVAKKKAGA